MAGIIRLQRAFASKLRPFANNRNISTSKKNSETVTVGEAAESKSEVKNWISYGFDYKSKSADRNALHAMFFTSVTLCLVGGVYIFMYLPDMSLKDWSQRQAYLELKRREKAGLPLIDPNLVDPAKIILPSDEELGDTEIII